MIVKKEECCGCANCENICSKEAISMITDSLGFKYPNINQNKCIQCGLCEKVCPSIKKSYINEYKKKSYVFKIKGIKQRIKCQSGGAFTALAKFILDNGGIVYGVSLDNNLKAVYERVTDKKRIKALQGSKYVQADMIDSVKLVKQDLLNNKIVLYCGTPCIVDAVKSYMKSNSINCENLILVEFLCHGVLSPEIYEEYVNNMRIKYKNVSNFNFRDKTVLGWGTYYSTFETKRNVKIASKTYLKIFHSDNYFRDSCYSCKYANMNRVADITLSDYWGIAKYKKKLSDKIGVSMILCNSKKAEYLIQSINGFKEETPLETIIQRPLEEPTLKPKKIELYRQNIEKNGYGNLFQEYKSNEVLLWHGIALSTDINFILNYYSCKIKMTSIYKIIRGCLKFRK